MTQGSMPFAIDDGFRMPVETVDGGIRQDLAMAAMPPNAWLDLLNTEYGDNGELQSRGGETIYNPTALDTLDNGIRFYKESTGTKTLIVSADTGANMKIYKGLDSTGAMTEITGGTALTTALPIEFLTFRNHLLISNGTQTIQYLTDPTGTTKADCVFSDNNIKAKYMTEADNRLWVVDPAHPNRVHMSEDGFFTTGPGTDCSFPTNNHVDVPGNFNDHIVALKTFDKEVFVYQTKAIWMITGVDISDWAMNKIADIGVLNNRAISMAALGDDELGGLSGMLLANERSIWFWDPNSGDPIDIGKYAREAVAAGVFESSTFTYTENAVIGYSTASKRFYVSFRKDSSSTYNDISITVDAKLRVARVEEGACAFVDCGGNGDTGAFYRLSPDTGGGGTEGFIYEMNTGTQDNYQDFTVTMKTKHFNMGKTSAPKRMRVLYLATSAESSTDPINIRAICDRGASVFSFTAYTTRSKALFGTARFGYDKFGGGEVFEYVSSWFPFGVQCQEVQLEISVTSSSNFKLYGYEIEYEEYPVRRN